MQAMLTGFFYKPFLLNKTVLHIVFIFHGICNRAVQITNKNAMLDGISCLMLTKLNTSCLFFKSKENMSKSYRLKLKKNNFLNKK